MTRVYIKEKRFLKNFTMILLLLLVIVVLIVSVTYRMTMNALESEIENLHQNTTYELKNNVEEVLQQCNLLASRLVIDARVQLYYTHTNPDYLVSGYYSMIDSKLNSHAAKYIESIILYAPKFDRMLSSQDGDTSYSMEMAREDPSNMDVSWLETVKAQEKRSTSYVVRAKNDRWPYYVSIMKNFSSGMLEGSVVLNINLIKLHDHLMAGRDATMQIFLVDGDRQVILQNDKEALFVPVEEIDALGMYRPGETFSVLQTVDGSSYVYAQVYSQEYDLTCVTYTQVNDYYTQIVEVQTKILLTFVLAFLVVVAVASLFSIKLVKPLQDIQRLLDSPAVAEGEQGQYDENIREIADQIISHLQTNSKLRQELDSRLDLLKDTQMLALQAQINPHFLFNTLNAISLTVESDCGETHPGVLMLNELSFVLRYSLSDSGNISILEELEFVKKYLAIMEYRYGEIELHIHVDESLYHCAIPKLVLQPLVENSVQHGLAAQMSYRKSVLEISVRKLLHRYPSGVECPSVRIDIQDNGVGMEEQTLAQLRKRISDYSGISREHIGLSNVAHRFYLMFHNEQEVQVDSVLGKGTRVSVIFPMKNQEET